MYDEGGGLGPSCGPCPPCLFNNPQRALRKAHLWTGGGTGRRLRPLTSGPRRSGTGGESGTTGRLEDTGRSARPRRGRDPKGGLFTGDATRAAPRGPTKADGTASQQAGTIRRVPPVPGAPTGGVTGAPTGGVTCREGGATRVVRPTALPERPATGAPIWGGTGRAGGETRVVRPTALLERPPPGAPTKANTGTVHGTIRAVINVRPPTGALTNAGGATRRVRGRIVRPHTFGPTRDGSGGCIGTPRPGGGCLSRPVQLEPQAWGRQVCGRGALALPGKIGSPQFRPWSTTWTSLRVGLLPTPALTVVCALPSGRRGRSACATANPWGGQRAT